MGASASVCCHTSAECCSPGLAPWAGLPRGVRLLTNHPSRPHRLPRDLSTPIAKLWLCGSVWQNTALCGISSNTIKGSRTCGNQSRKNEVSVKMQPQVPVGGTDLGIATFKRLETSLPWMGCSCTGHSWSWSCPWIPLGSS